MATILAEEGQTEEAFAYLEEIGPESNWYVASLLVKADLYQLEGLADVAREKLVEAASLSDDPIIMPRRRLPEKGEKGPAAGARARLRDPRRGVCAPGAGIGGDAA